jgi:hypothetical protein
MTAIVSYETIAGTTVTIEADGRAYINAEHAPATATELRQLAMLLLATADEVDA